MKSVKLNWVVISTILTVSISGLWQTKIALADSKSEFEEINSNLNWCLTPYLYLSNTQDAQFNKLVDRFAGMNLFDSSKIVSIAQKAVAEKSEYYSKHKDLNAKDLETKTAQTCAAKLGIAAPNSGLPDVYDARIDPYVASKEENQYCATNYYFLKGVQDDKYKTLIISASVYQNLEISKIEKYIDLRTKHLKGLLDNGTLPFLAIENGAKLCQSKGLNDGADTLIASYNARVVKEKSDALVLAQKQKEYEEAKKKDDKEKEHDTICLNVTQSAVAKIKPLKTILDKGPRPFYRECDQGGFSDSCYDKTSTEGVINQKNYCAALRSAISDANSKYCYDLSEQLESNYTFQECDRF